MAQPIFMPVPDMEWADMGQVGDFTPYARSIRFLSSMRNLANANWTPEFTIWSDPYSATPLKTFNPANGKCVMANGTILLDYVKADVTDLANGIYTFGMRAFDDKKTLRLHHLGLFFKASDLAGLLSLVYSLSLFSLVKQTVIYVPDPETCLHLI